MNIHEDTVQIKFFSEKIKPFSELKPGETFKIAIPNIPLWDHEKFLNTYIILHWKFHPLIDSSKAEYYALYMDLKSNRIEFALEAEMANVKVLPVQVHLLIEDCY